MKNRLLSIAMLVMILVFVTACDKKSAGLEASLDEIAMKPSCTYASCMYRLSNNSSIEKVTSIVGFKGELIDEKYQKYYFKFSETTGITVAYYNSNKATISLTYNEKDIILKNLVFDDENISYIRKKIKTGITYNEVIVLLGNTDGILIEKGILNDQYIWTDSSGKYIKGIFNKKNKCVYFSDFGKVSI